MYYSPCFLGGVEEKIFPANTSANDILETCVVYVNNNSGEHDVKDIPTNETIGHLIVFKTKPWWGNNEICVTQLFVTNSLYYTSDCYFRFKNNNRSFSQISWRKVAIAS